MKKTLIVVGIVLAVVLLPVLGMAISPTRDLLLGLTPDEQILKLADQIDNNRVSSEQTDSKVTELQSTIDAQQVKLAEQQKLIDDQKTDIQTANDSIKTTNETVAKQKDCSADIAKYCKSDSFTNPDKFQDFLDVYKEHDNYEKYKAEFTIQFNNCQKAMKCN